MINESLTQSQEPQVVIGTVISSSNSQNQGSNFPDYSQPITSSQQLMEEVMRESRLDNEENCSSSNGPLNSDYHHSPTIVSPPPNSSYSSNQIYSQLPQRSSSSSVVQPMGIDGMIHHHHPQQQQQLPNSMMNIDNGSYDRSHSYPIQTTTAILVQPTNERNEVGVQYPISYQISSSHTQFPIDQIELGKIVKKATLLKWLISIDLFLIVLGAIQFFLVILFIIFPLFGLNGIRYFKRLHISFYLYYVVFDMVMVILILIFSASKYWLLPYILLLILDIAILKNGRELNIALSNLSQDQLSMLQIGYRNGTIRNEGSCC